MGLENASPRKTARVAKVVGTCILKVRKIDCLIVGLCGTELVEDVAIFPSHLQVSS